MKRSTRRFGDLLKKINASQEHINKKNFVKAKEQSVEMKSKFDEKRDEALKINKIVNENFNFDDFDLFLKAKKKVSEYPL